MICPHCSTAVLFDFHRSGLLKLSEHGIGLQIAYSTCPNCDEIVVFFEKGTHSDNPEFLEDLEGTFDLTIVYPSASNFQFQESIPQIYFEDYEEAIKIISASSKASAALSRRILQNILREEFKIKERTLSMEIERFIEREGIPSHLTDAVDAVRNIGNFAAHPSKDLNTGEIVSVENGEAEWLIEVIEALFDFTFIQPKKLERRIGELNKKLDAMGKPPMKIKK